MRLCTPILIAGIALALPAVSYAQISPFRSDSRSGFTNEDFGLMQEAARELASKPGIAPGSSAPWTNQRTGASGSVTIASAFRNRGMSCYKVNYEGRPTPGQPERTTTVNWCKTPEGWKML